MLISALHRQEEKLLAELEVERTMDSKGLSPQQIDDLIELVSRFRFFQGENLSHFTSALKQRNFQDAKNLIQQKFAAQKKPKPEQQAGEVLSKLLASVITSSESATKN